MQIRAAQERDQDGIVRIYNAAIRSSTATFDTETFTVQTRRPWFAQFGDEHPLRVCTDDDGALLGFAYYLPYRPKPAYARTKELTVYVDEACRQDGVGTALYTALIEHAVDRGVHALLAVIAGHNPASEALHRRLGFEPVGHLREVGHKFGAWVDTHYWEKLL